MGDQAAEHVYRGERCGRRPTCGQIGDFMLHVYVVDRWSEFKTQIDRSRSNDGEGQEWETRGGKRRTDAAPRRAALCDSGDIEKQNAAGGGLLGFVGGRKRSGGCLETSPPRRLLIKPKEETSKERKGQARQTKYRLVDHALSFLLLCSRSRSRSSSSQSLVRPGVAHAVPLPQSDSLTLQAPNKQNTQTDSPAFIV